MSTSVKKAATVLRLDSGALIGRSDLLGVKTGPPRIVKLSAKDAYASGKVTDKEINRLEALVRQAKLIKRRAESELQANCPPKKRSRVKAPGAGTPSCCISETCSTSTQMIREPVVANPPEGCDDNFDMLAACSKDSVPESDETIAGAHAEDPTGFARKCQNILDLVIADLASNAHIFMNAVDPKDVPDYYNIVKTPMDLTTIKNKLAAGAYSKGTEFADDVRLVWKNCFLYNKKGDFVEKLGRRGELFFENHWAMSGLAEEPRMKRSNAGVAAAKYDPTIEVKQEKPAQKTGPANKTVQNRKKSVAGKRPVQPPVPGTQNGTASVKSEEGEDKPMSREQMEELADGLGRLDEKALSDVIRIIRESSNGFEYKEGEDIELDIGELSTKTLWKLATFMKSQKVKQAEGVFVNKDSSSDSSDSSDSDDSSDSE